MRLLLLLSLLLLPSCVLSRASDNEPLDKTKLERLQPGKTTAREVVDLFGAPNDVVQLAGRSAYLYEHSRAKTAGLLFFVVAIVNSDERADRLWVFFDEKNVLTHFGATAAAERAEWAFPWSDLYDGRK